MTAYIEYLGAVVLRRHDLSDGELNDIGEFTRENILRWFESHRGVEWVGVCPVKDFHAVSGGIDIPWATEEGRRVWEKVHSIASQRSKSKQDLLASKEASVSFDVKN